MSTLSPTQLPLAPLGAGDLIDRAVRLYRRHLFVLIRTAAPPVIIVAAGWILFRSPSDEYSPRLKLMICFSTRFCG